MFTNDIPFYVAVKILFLLPPKDALKLIYYGLPSSKYNNLREAGLVDLFSRATSSGDIKYQIAILKNGMPLSNLHSDKGVAAFYTQLKNALMSPYSTIEHKHYGISYLCAKESSVQPCLVEESQALQSLKGSLAPKNITQLIKQFFVESQNTNRLDSDKVKYLTPYLNDSEIELGLQHAIALLYTQSNECIYEGLTFLSQTFERFNTKQLARINHTIMHCIEQQVFKETNHSFYFSQLCVLFNLFAQLTLSFAEVEPKPFFIFFIKHYDFDKHLPILNTLKALMTKIEREDLHTLIQDLITQMRKESQASFKITCRVIPALCQLSPFMSSLNIEQTKQAAIACYMKFDYQLCGSECGNTIIVRSANLIALYAHFNLKERLDILNRTFTLLETDEDKKFPKIHNMFIVRLLYQFKSELTEIQKQKLIRLFITVINEFDSEFGRCDLVMFNDLLPHFTDAQIEEVVAQSIKGRHLYFAPYTDKSYTMAREHLFLIIAHRLSPSQRYHIVMHLILVMSEPKRVKIGLQALNIIHSMMISNDIILSQSMLMSLSDTACHRLLRSNGMLLNHHRISNLRLFKPAPQNRSPFVFNHLHAQLHTKVLNQLISYIFEMESNKQYDDVYVKKPAYSYLSPYSQEANKDAEEKYKTYVFACALRDLIHQNPHRPMSELINDNVLSLLQEYQSLPKSLKSVRCESLRNILYLANPQLSLFKYDVGRFYTSMSRSWF